jgi:hypothetical protein
MISRFADLAFSVAGLGVERLDLSVARPKKLRADADLPTLRPRLVG